MVKVATSWSDNVSGEANEYAYDSAVHAYDSTTQNYDGVVDADLSDSEKAPADWDAA